MGSRKIEIYPTIRAKYNKQQKEAEIRIISIGFVMLKYNGFGSYKDA